jgi:starch phosphorylase
MAARRFYDVDERVRERCVFTTHTPVPAAKDVFSADLIDSFFAEYWPQLGLSREQFLALGARRPGDPWELFSMTVLALRMTRRPMGSANATEPSVEKFGRPFTPICCRAGAHRLHYQRGPCPLLDGSADDGSVQPIPGERLVYQTGRPPGVEQGRPDSRWELWRRHGILKERLIAYARSKTRSARLERGEAADDIKAVDHLLDPNVLTLGFARRFSPYKRGALLFRDLHRAIRILSNPRMPIQIIFAGKAHPADDEGKRHDSAADGMVPPPGPARSHCLHRRLRHVPGQAHGAGGRCVAEPSPSPRSLRHQWPEGGFNGGINCGIPRWLVGRSLPGVPRQHPRNGWMPSAKTPRPATRPCRTRSMRNPSTTCWNTRSRRCITSEIAAACPNAGLRMMKASIRTNCPQFNTDRMMAEYVTQMYLPEAITTIEPVMASAMS